MKAAPVPCFCFGRLESRPNRQTGMSALHTQGSWRASIIGGPIARVLPSDDRALSQFHVAIRVAKIDGSHAIGKTVSSRRSGDVRHAHALGRRQVADNRLKGGDGVVEFLRPALFGPRYGARQSRTGEESRRAVI